MDDLITRDELRLIVEAQYKYINGTLGRIETVVGETLEKVSVIDSRLQAVEGCERDRETATRVVKHWKENLAWALGISIALISITSFILTFVR